jgi:hypothetical protein
VRKFLLIILLIFSSYISAQDSIAVKEPVKKLVSKFTEKDIYVDNVDTIVAKNFPKDFKNKYKTEDFIYEFKEPEKNAWDRFKEWLASFFTFSNPEKSIGLIELIFKIFAIIIIIVVVYLLVKAILNKEGKWIFGRNSSKNVINYTEVEKNLHLIDFEKLITQTLQSGEQRLSIRYYYLWLLKKMAANGIIEWDIEKTNSDYLYEIKKQATKEEFEYLSYIYNNIWYGEFDLDNDTFIKAKNAFENALKSMPNV